ncbi:hypothetical protein CL614_00020 [archaeon]|nr:hypothetical protein [archaeon]|tara:strand:+ start:363 stop:701 length:339 start_codon:yes stop_codon:yes gene_type:complete
MKLAVVGSRTFKDYILLNQTLSQYDNVTEIVSGGAGGADSLAKKYAEENRIKYVEFKPNWNRYGKRAGFIRNKDIWEYSDRGVAFWDGASPGTRQSLELSEFFRKKLDLIKF